jgi:hypothetical protein
MMRTSTKLQQKTGFIVVVATMTIATYAAMLAQQQFLTAVDGFVIPPSIPAASESLPLSLLTPPRNNDKPQQLLRSSSSSSSSLPSLLVRQKKNGLLNALSTDEDLSSSRAVYNSTTDDLNISSSSSSSSSIASISSSTVTTFSDADVAALEASFQQPALLSRQQPLQSSSEQDAEAIVDAKSTTSSSTSSSPLAALGWRAVIVALCAFWASNFAVAKMVMSVDGVDSSLYALSRFTVAATALAPFAISGWKKANMDAETLRTSIICGSWVAFGYLGQTRKFVDGTVLFVIDIRFRSILMISSFVFMC